MNQPLTPDEKMVLQIADATGHIVYLVLGEGAPKIEVVKPPTRPFWLLTVKVPTKKGGEKYHAVKLPQPVGVASGALAATWILRVLAKSQGVSRSKMERLIASRLAADATVAALQGKGDGGDVSQSVHLRGNPGEFSVLDARADNHSGAADNDVRGSSGRSVVADRDDSQRYRDGRGISGSDLPRRSD